MNYYDKLLVEVIGSHILSVDGVASDFIDFNNKEIKILLKAGRYDLDRFMKIYIDVLGDVRRVYNNADTKILTDIDMTNNLIKGWNENVNGTKIHS